MKKEYVKPIIYSEKFVANEFIAACYKIRCTTPNNNSFYKYIYADSNNNGEWDSGDEKLYSRTFRGCNEWHKGVIRDSAPVANGFVTTKEWNPWGSNSYEEVFYWYEDLNSDADIHVMVPGSQNYETNPNAS